MGSVARWIVATTQPCPRPRFVGGSEHSARGWRGAGSTHGRGADAVFNLRLECCERMLGHALIIPLREPMY